MTEAVQGSPAPAVGRFAMYQKQEAPRQSAEERQRLHRKRMLIPPQLAREAAQVMALDQMRHAQAEKARKLREAEREKERGQKKRKRK